MAVANNSENLVIKAGWFSAKSYENTADATLETGENFIRIKTGSFRPKYVISVQAYTIDGTTKKFAAPIFTTFVDLDQKVVDASGKVSYNDYVKLYINDGATAPTVTNVRYKLLLME